MGSIHCLRTQSLNIVKDGGIPGHPCPIQKEKENRSIKTPVHARAAGGRMPHSINVQTCTKSCVVLFIVAYVLYPYHPV